MPGPERLPNSCTQYRRPVTLRATATAVYWYRKFSMLARWLGEFSQPCMTGAALVYPWAMFSAQYAEATG